MHKLTSAQERARLEEEQSHREQVALAKARAEQEARSVASSMRKAGCCLFIQRLFGRRRSSGEGSGKGGRYCRYYCLRDPCLLSDRQAEMRKEEAVQRR